MKALAAVEQGVRGIQAVESVFAGHYNKAVSSAYNIYSKIDDLYSLHINTGFLPK